MRRTCLAIALWFVAAGMPVFGQQLPPWRYLVPPGLLELDDKQRQHITQARRDLYQRHCDITGRMMDVQETLHRLYAQEPRDAKQIGQTFRQLAELQQQLLEARIEAENRVHAVLTAEQRRRLQQWRQGKLRPSYPESLPYLMHPGQQAHDFEPLNLEDPERLPQPAPGDRLLPRGGSAVPPRP